MANNTFELSAQMILFANAKGRGAAKLITPAYNIMQSLSEYEKFNDAISKDVELTAEQKTTITTVVKAASIGKDDKDKVNIEGKISDVDVVILSDSTKYESSATPVQKEELATLIDSFIDIQSDKNKADSALPRTKTKIETGFKNLKGATAALIKQGATGKNQDTDITAALGVKKFYEKKGSPAKETGVLIKLRACKAPKKLDDLKDKNLVAFKNAYAEAINSTKNGGIDFNLFTAKKTQAENIVRTEEPIVVKKETLKSSFGFKDDSFAGKAIPETTEVEFELDLDKNDLSLGVKVNFGEKFYLNGNKDVFYLNQSTLLFIRKTKKD